MRMGSLDAALKGRSSTVALPDDCASVEELPFMDASGLVEERPFMAASKSPSTGALAPEVPTNDFA